MTDFLFDAGTNGFIVSPFDLQTTELNSLTNNNSAISSVGGTSGVFNQTSTGNAILGQMWFLSGGTFTPSLSAYISGWFINSSDGGTTFEKTVSNTIMPRAPDFVIPLLNSAYASGEISWTNGITVALPQGSFKVFVINGTGGTLPSSGNKIKLGPIAVKY